MASNRITGGAFSHAAPARYNPRRLAAGEDPIAPGLTRRARSSYCGGTCMVDPLATLLADGVIEEVIGRLKTGKEAELWLVRHGGEVTAAKVYKARHARSFRNNASYKEGRQVRDTRTQRAMDRGSRFGQAAAEDAWKAKESDALHALHAAGVRVPRPVMFYEGVLLMEVVVDADGHAAPRLVDAQVPREQAAALYADLRGQMIRMLGCDLVHGDLSPYNVLLGWNGPVIIDFPQVIGAAHNSQAEAFFQRDLQNLLRFFAALDPSLHASAGDGREIWRAYVRRELTPDFVPTGRSPEPARHGHAHRPPGGAPHRSAHPDQRDRAGRAPPPRGGSPGRPATAHAGPRPPGPSGQQPGQPPSHRRNPGPRRRETPMPEVIRVGRPPLGPPAATAAAPQATPHSAPPRPADQGGQPPPRHRRHRGPRRPKAPTG
jgi:RIO kinase 1